MDRTRGPKLHISLNKEDPANIALAWDTLLPLLIKYGVRTCKVIAGDLSKFQPGKEIVIYMFDSKPSLDWKCFVREASANLDKRAPGINPLFRFKDDTLETMMALYSLPIDDEKRSSRSESTIIELSYFYLSFNGLRSDEPIPRDFDAVLASLTVSHLSGFGIIGGFAAATESAAASGGAHGGAGSPASTPKS